MCAQSRRRLHPTSPTKNPAYAGFFESGRPDLNRGPHRPELRAKFGATVKSTCKSLGLRCELTSSQILGFCGSFPGFRQRDRVAAQRRHRRQRPAGRLLLFVPTMYRADHGPCAEQAGDHARRQPLGRRQALEHLSPRRRACVRERSWEDGSLQHWRRRSSVTATTRSRVQRRSMKLSPCCFQPGP